MACIVFVGNCNFRCSYCHNPCLVFDPESQPLIREDNIYRFLEKRRGRLDGIVISGGEPSLRPRLPEFAARVKSLGFLVKIDTNGSNPGLVREMRGRGCVDALGIDYKAPSFKYNQIAGSNLSDIWERTRSLIQFAAENGIHTDVRTTVHKDMLSQEDLAVMRKELSEMGQEDWTLQQFNPAEILDDKLKEAPTYSDKELMDIARSLGPRTYVRGLRGFFLTGHPSKAQSV
jgi:pyruvate formate lyase activating enzyme